MNREKEKWEQKIRESEKRPIPAEWCKAVAPKLVAIVGSAPRSIRYLAVAVCPWRAAWMRAVSPEKQHQYNINRLEL